MYTIPWEMLKAAVLQICMIKCKRKKFDHFKIMQIFHTPSKPASMWKILTIPHYFSSLTRLITSLWLSTTLSPVYIYNNKDKHISVPYNLYSYPFEYSPALNKRGFDGNFSTGFSLLSNRRRTCFVLSQPQATRPQPNWSW